MAKPGIFVVDDDPDVIAAVVRDVRREYGSDYRVLRADSGEAALQAVRTLKERDEPMALFLVDQRMPRMSGVEFLTEAMQVYPQAKRVLLTAYADTEAAIRAINDVDLDYYLLKPWDPPQEKLYPVLDDLLGKWGEGYRPPFQGIRVVGYRWSAPSYQAKDFLARNQVPYQWLDVELDEEARKLASSVGPDGQGLPIVLFPDGTRLTEPTNLEIAEKIGLSTQAQKPFYDLVIVGGGPAGLAAAVYGASEGLRTVMLEQQAPGGQAGTSSRIENYLGFPAGLSGADLTSRAVAQARRFGVEMLTPQEVVGARVQGAYRIVQLASGAELSCHALLIATGVSWRKLDVPGIDRLLGAGVYYGGASTEAISCRDQDVYIIGGANSAGQAAMYLSQFARCVVLLVRGNSLEKGMSQYLIEQIRKTPNIRVRLGSQVTEAHGENSLESITISNDTTGQTETVPAAGLFIFIGAMPHTDWLDGVVERDSRGFILTGPDLSSDGQRARDWKLDRDPFLLESNVPGIFVAGDVRHGSVKRVASGVGEGSIAVQFIHQYLAKVPL